MVNTISGGDQDFRVWRWRKILDALRNPSANQPLLPEQTCHLAQKTLGLRGALLPFNEINDIAVSAGTTNRVFLAGGDSAAHEWDLETATCVRQYEGHSDYLHSVRHLQHSQEIITGSEDGTVGIWDVRSAALLTFLQPKPKKNKRAGANGAAATTSATAANSLWVGSVATDASETWLACGGGKKRSLGLAPEPGFIAMWHLPSRVTIHYTPTPSDVQDLSFFHTELLSVGNEACVRKWNRSSGELLSTAHSNVASSRFCVTDESTDMIAVGGNGPLIDVYTMPGVVGFSLRVC